MKIETEVHNSLYSFTSSEGKCGGCSVNGGELPPIAQDGSIGRPERQLTPPGCYGGCGPSSSAAENNNNSPTFTTSKSDFECEHFQYIDEDVSDEDEDVPTIETSAGQKPSSSISAESAAPATDSTTVPNGTATAPGSHLNNKSPSSDHPVEVNGHTMPRDDTKSEAAHHHHKGHSVKRQVSFEESATHESAKEIKSVLKKGNRLGKRQKNRVTFDEAVTLYSDECEEVQHLALTTGPDIVYTEVFYMFEPPIEYQDVPPFEPPAEYRDSEEAPVAKPDPPVENGPKPENNSDTPVESVVSEESSEKNSVPAPEVAVSNETENTDSVVITEEPPSDSVLKESSTNESEKLFQRFSEAEREFAVDEELNSVFHELNSEFGTDCSNGDLSNDYFRSLITCLTAAECGIPVSECDLFPSVNFELDSMCREISDNDGSKTHSRTLSEADSDCSISSQDTIIVRYGEEESEPGSDTTTKGEDAIIQDSSEVEKIDTVIKQEERDEVFNDTSLDHLCEDEKPRPLPRESLLNKSSHAPPTALVKLVDEVNGESLSRQSSGEQSVNSGTSQDPPPDADDSTSSDSRSGEVEEEIRLDDIGYDEEDAEDYDEESFRGMAHGNSKIRRIIKKNALQCTLFRGIEAKRRQQPGIKYPRPKSPLLSQESLVEKLKWLTTIDEQKDIDGPMNFHSKPPDVILSTGGIPANGSIPHSASSEDDIVNQTALSYQQPQFYHRVIMPSNSKGGYYVRHDGYPPTHHPSLPRQRVSCSGHSPQSMSHTLPYPPNRMVIQHPPNSQVQWSEQRNNGSMTVPRNFRDWRVIQRVMVNRNNDGHSRNSHVPADYVRCSNGSASSGGYSCNVPPDVSRTSQPPLNFNPDELAQFVEKDTARLERIRKRYSVAEEDEDPTFGFARRPSVRGVQSRIQLNPSDIQGHGINPMDPYKHFEESGQGLSLVHPRSASYNDDQLRSWSRDPNWRPENGPGQHYGQPMPPGRSQAPMHIHRASVALTELPGSATIPYTHRKPHLDTRYHSYAESMYGSTRTLPTKGWQSADHRSCMNVPNPNSSVSSPMLQVPLHPVAKDERGVPEGASSSPKVSSDSLYHAPVPESIASGGPHKDEGVIYYSLNV
ncbi:uncharacterized protein [Parasteatoda tepidariorum]|uniref:uncharacterized protein n=1 Tax=Parasteatoda tepidariorum TaxID=114398 RepID=UPI00077FDFAE|nr:uncharacterized protein LOC107455008 [Parasteatoda tepidariorum]XP_015927886.1 uncharacterized protein LOC107455008 [Parasteatoda tepidariorum]XP_042898198.1 uncharacterized protein LOC107455008 [Parasteatoda tepidariorum]XP_042898202.1 uncharacterized protein LOC107455008 [Parasteatoda tepidariorum]